MSHLPRFLPTCVLFLALLFVVSAANFRSRVTEETEATPPPICRETVRGAAPSDDAPLEQALAWIGQARQACSQVRDYRCVLATRERVRGKLQPEQVMDLEFRAQPFAVHLRFSRPSSSAGQEVWFGEGLHGDKLRVRPAGYLGALTGMMLLDPHSPTVRENSRHAITDAGFANMLERFVSNRQAQPAEVRCSTVTLGERTCRRIELVSTQEAEWHTAALCIDSETHLPVRVEYHDREGRLLDEATYRNIECNVGLGDGAFGG